MWKIPECREQLVPATFDKIWIKLNPAIKQVKLKKIQKTNQTKNPQTSVKEKKGLLLIE